MEETKTHHAAVAGLLRPWIPVVVEEHWKSGAEFASESIRICQHETNISWMSNKSDGLAVMTKTYVTIKCRGYRAMSLHRLRSALLLLWLSLGVAGCSTSGLVSEQPKPVTVAEIVQMSKEGVPARSIVQKMRDSASVYRLPASELARLHEQGVADKVLNYMQRTYLKSVRREQRFQDWNYWSSGPAGYWYGGWPYGWPRAWS